MTEKAITPLALCITFDIDNDFLFEPTEGRSLEWTGLRQGVPLVLEQVRAWADEIGIEPKTTFFVRADAQISESLGRADAILSEARELFEREKAKGVAIEIGWHPHLYSQRGGRWVVETDGSAQYDQLLSTWGRVKETHPEIVVSRIGECLFSPSILRALVECGIDADFSALPGRKVNTTDWSACPQHPYHPDESAFDRTGASPLLEVPFTMLSIKAPYESKERKRYVNLVFAEEFLCTGFTELVNHPGRVITVTHPFETCVAADPGRKKHALWGGADAVYRNLSRLSAICKAAQRNIGCCSAADIIGDYPI